MVEHIEKLDSKNVFTECPILIIEIVSDSTRIMDNITKFITYQKIPTLKEYILIEQDFAHVQVFSRQNNWRGRVYLIGEEVRFESINLILAVEKIYDSIEFEESEESDSSE